MSQDDPIDPRFGAAMAARQETAGQPGGADQVGSIDEPDRWATVAQLRDRIDRVAEQPTGPGLRPASREGRGRSTGDGRTGRRGRSEPVDGVVSPPADFDAAARSICLRLLTGAARSRSDLATALARKGIPDEVAERVLDRYTEVGLIDDGAYAQALVRTKHRERGLGRRSLAVELRRKGIDEASAEQALSQIDGDDERRRATELVTKKLNAALAAGPEAARRRLVGMLSRRGYPPGLAYDIVSAAMAGRGLDPSEDLEPLG